MLRATDSSGAHATASISLVINHGGSYAIRGGMRVQWKGLRDKATNTVLTSWLEVN